MGPERQDSHKIVRGLTRRVMPTKYFRRCGSESSKSLGNKYFMPREAQCKGSEGAVCRGCVRRCEVVHEAAVK